MTTSLSDAMEWLDRWQDDPRIEKANAHIRAIKAELAKPRLPDGNDPKWIDAMYALFEHMKKPEASAASLLECLRHELTAPKVKEVEVEWWGVMNADGRILDVWRSKENAENSANGKGAYLVRLTGKATVPA